MKKADNVQKGPRWRKYSQFKKGGRAYNILQDGNKSSVHAFVSIFGLVVYFFPATWPFQMSSKVDILSFPSAFQFCSSRCEVTLKYMKKLEKYSISSNMYYSYKLNSMLSCIFLKNMVPCPNSWKESTIHKKMSRQLKETRKYWQDL